MHTHTIYSNATCSFRNIYMFILQSCSISMTERDSWRVIHHSHSTYTRNTRKSLHTVEDPNHPPMTSHHTSSHHITPHGTWAATMVCPGSNQSSNGRSNENPPGTRPVTTLNIHIPFMHYDDRWTHTKHTHFHHHWRWVREICNEIRRILIWTS